MASSLASVTSARELQENDLFKPSFNILSQQSLTDKILITRLFFFLKRGGRGHFTRLPVITDIINNHRWTVLLLKIAGSS